MIFFSSLWHLYVKWFPFINQMAKYWLWAYQKDSSAVTQILDQSDYSIHKFDSFTNDSFFTIRLALATIENTLEISINYYV